MIFADVLCTFVFVIGLVLLVVIVVVVRIRKMLKWKIWLHGGK